MSLRTLSDRFKVIPTDQLLNEASIAAREMGLNPQVIQGHTYSQVRFPELQVADFGGLVPQVWIKNRNDGTTTCQIIMGLFRMICSNGLMVGIDEFRAKVRHIQGPKVETFLESFHAEAVNAFHMLESTMDTAHEMLERDIPSPDKAIEVVSSLNLTNTVKEAAIYRIATGHYRKEDHPSTAWGLYNIVNELNRRASRRNSLTYLEREEDLASDIMLLTDSEFESVKAS